MTPFARRVCAAVLACGLGACGGGDDGGAAARPAQADRSGERAPAPARPSRFRPADPAAVRTIQGWVDAARRARYDRAASYFTLPTVVANGTPPVQLRTRAQVRAFNASLPCGAVLTRAVARGTYTVATFRLTSRPNSRCDAPGSSASTAFLIRRGKIAQWLRVADRPTPGRPPAPQQTVTGRSPEV
jgi:hypothetical protein